MTIRHLGVIVEENVASGRGGKRAALKKMNNISKLYYLKLMRITSENFIKIGS